MTNKDANSAAPDQTNAEVSDERLREIIDGCEGVQGGPWQLDAFACYVWAPSEKGGDFPLMDELGEKGCVAELRGWGYYTGNGHGALGLDPDEARRRQKLTGEHVARLDPATVKALATELLTRRSVTSQASEGQPVLWVSSKQLPDPVVGGYAAARAAPEGNFDTPLYASSSKRVERLETALQQIKARTYSDDRGCALAADAVAEISEIASQALHGGRS